MESSHQNPDAENTWDGDFDPFADPEERRVLFAAMDSFRYVDKYFAPSITVQSGISGYILAQTSLGEGSFTITLLK